MEDDEVESDEADGEEEDEISDDADDEGDGEENTQKSGWADAMAKVLNSAKASEPSKVVLSKARKDYEVKNKTIMKKSDDTEESKNEAEKEPATKTFKLKQSSLRSQKLAVESVSRTKPQVVRDKAKEKSLNKIATKGVVQLFNAVKKQQVDLKKDLNSVGKSIRKRERVYQSIDKNSFLENVLGAKTTSSKEVAPSKVPINKKTEESMDVDGEGSYPKSWCVLRDDFMMGAKMKDWDKQSDSEG
ncbi:unnamed protein product [Lepeophtheirus salmonis]|nr:unnamed protein product [Lepeophtheirus salmonis]CAF2929942.1 unnamed protein product [Lepeophtheirus salmonis]